MKQQSWHLMQLPPQQLPCPQAAPLPPQSPCSSAAHPAAVASRQCCASSAGRPLAPRSCPAAPAHGWRPACSGCAAGWRRSAAWRRTHTQCLPRGLRQARFATDYLPPALDFLLLIATPRLMFPQLVPFDSNEITERVGSEGTGCRRGRRPARSGFSRAGQHSSARTQQRPQQAGAPSQVACIMRFACSPRSKPQSKSESSSLSDRRGAPPCRIVRCCCSASACLGAGSASSKIAPTAASRAASVSAGIQAAVDGLGGEREQGGQPPAWVKSEPNDGTAAATFHALLHNCDKSQQQLLQLLRNNKKQCCATPKHSVASLAAALSSPHLVQSPRPPARPAPQCSLSSSPA